MATRRNVLIVGAGGFVGQALVRRLSKTHSDLFLTARSKIPKLSVSKVFYGDLSNLEFCKKIVKNIDIVYYLAGFKKNIEIHTKKPFDAISSNILPLSNFLEAVKNSRVKKIIYVSSVLVEYASLEDGRIDGYVWGKYANELILKSFAVQTGIDVKIVRSAAVYGPGSDFDPYSANLIPALIMKVSEAEDKIVVWGKGIRKLQFVYIDDLASNLVAAERSRGNFFVVGNDEVVTVNKVVDKIIKLMGKKLKVLHDLSKPDKSSKLAIFKNALAPMVDLNTGLEKTLHYYQNAVENHAKHTDNHSNIQRRG